MSKKTLEERFKLFQEGKAEMPVIEKSGEVKADKEEYKVILTEELEDRDGEVVIVRGMKIPENGVPFIDRHDMNGSVIATRLGTVKNIRIEGNKIVGDIKMVDTMAGNEARKIMDDPEHPFPVSMGFGVMDYDPDTKEIREWELFELSAVNVPSNIRARVLKSIHIEETDKKLKHYEDIRKTHREFIKLFLSDSFTKAIGYTKTGDLLIDIANINDVVLNRFKALSLSETPKASTKVERPKTIQLTEEQSNRIADIFVNNILKS